MEGFPLKRLGEVREAFERTHFIRRWKASNMVSWCVPYKTLSVLDGPIWSSPSLFGLHQDKKIHTQKSPKMESSMRLSPRRIKSTPTIMLYELRMIGLKTRPSSLLRKLEAIIKKWRGLVRWYMQGHTSMRSEVVIHMVGERFGRVNRVDNLVASWRRAIARILF